MPTTPSGLPYPADTDPVNATAQAIKALAELIDTRYIATDSAGWQTVAVAAGYTGDVLWRRRQNTVTMSIRAAKNATAGAANASFTIATLPAEARPSATIRGGCVHGTTAPLAAGAVSVNTDGTVVVRNVTVAASSVLEANLSWSVS